MPGLENSAELIDWINEEVNLDSSADLFVADAMLKGAFAEGLDYAIGYQFRRFGVAATPNQPGDLSINPAPSWETAAASKRPERSPSPPDTTSTKTPRW